jgi:ubiquitin-protein ligase
MAINEIQTKKIMNFISYIKENPCEYYKAIPQPNNLLHWYVKIHNLSDEYTGGEYLVEITFPKEYPFKPPNYKVLTPSGRFQPNRNLCFTNSGINFDSWTPAWGIHEIIMGLISFFYERDSIGTGHIHSSSEAQRLVFTSKSVEYNKIHHNDILQLIENS